MPERRPLLGTDPLIEKYVVNLEKAVPLLREHTQNHHWMRAWRTHLEICREVQRMRLEAGKLYLLAPAHSLRVKRALRQALDTAAEAQEGIPQEAPEKRFLPFLKHFRKETREWAKKMISHTLTAAAESH